MNVKYLIKRAVEQYPDHTALICGDARMTFLELNNRANRLANALLKAGLRKGDRVGILMKNCPEFIETDFALSKAGLVRVPLNARLAESDHEYTLNDSQATAIIFGGQFTETVKSIKGNVPAVGIFVRVSNAEAGDVEDGCLDFEEMLNHASEEEPSDEIDEEDLHTLFYTSGTTGRPKGVMLTHKSWSSVTTNLILDYGPITEEDVILNLQPLSHGAGFFVLPFFVEGATNILLPEFKPSLIFETIERAKVTVLKLVPTMLYQLLDSPEKEQYNLSSLHSIIYGGSPIAVPRLVEAVKFFGKKLVQLYGQAEAPMCITTLSKKDHVIDGPEELVRQLKSAGKPCADVEVRIINSQGKEARPEEVGEVIVRGSHIMRGYWNRPDETAEVLKEGWVYTGDMGYFGSRGYIYLVDRKKDMIISGAFNIYAKEIEDIIISHPNVKDVAVIGVPDRKWGEAVKALVILKEGADVSAQEIIDYCQGKIAGFKKPKSVGFVKDLPRNPYGKIMKVELKKAYWKGFDRNIN